MVGMTPDRVLTNLDVITRREVEKYVGYSPQEQLYAVIDAEHHRYAVVGIPNWPRTLSASIVVLARIVGHQIVIEEDTTDKPLYQALMANASVPRHQIILAYAGEQAPDTETNGK
jgi:hypothetical protein